MYALKPGTFDIGVICGSDNVSDGDYVCDGCGGCISDCHCICDSIFVCGSGILSEAVEVVSIKVVSVAYGGVM